MNTDAPPIGPLMILFIVANLLIAGCYFYVAVATVPALLVRSKTAMAGFVFFPLCASTHLVMIAMALGWMSHYMTGWNGFILLAVHIPQAVATVLFGLWWDGDARSLRDTGALPVGRRG